MTIFEGKFRIPQNVINLKRRRRIRFDSIRNFSLRSSLTRFILILLSRNEKKKRKRISKAAISKREDSRLEGDEMYKQASGGVIAISAIFRVGSRPTAKSGRQVEQKGVGRKFSIDPWRCFEVRALRQHCGGGAPRCLRRRRQQARRWSVNRWSHRDDDLQ